MDYRRLRFITCLILIQACNHNHQITMKSLEDPRLPPDGAVVMNVKTVIAKNGYPQGFVVDAVSLKAGQRHFRQQCVICHGIDGSGNGFVTKRGLKKPDAFYEGEILKAAPEKIFQIMTEGYGRMPSMVRRLNEQQRWETAAYIKALQLSRSIPFASLDPSDQKKLP